MAQILISTLASLACIAAAVSEDSNPALFDEYVESQTDFLCERRTDGSVQCWPGVVAVRPDGVRGAIDGVLLESRCISILYEDGSCSCSIEEGSTFITSPSLAVEIRDLYHLRKEVGHEQEGLE